MPAGRTFLTVKIFCFGIEGELVAAAPGGLDDDLNDSVAFVYRFQQRGVCQTFGRLFCHCISPFL